MNIVTSELIQDTKQRPNIVFSSSKDNWETPKKLFELLNSVFYFGLDAAASQDNTKCPKFFTKENDALKQDWTKAVGMDVMWQVMDPVFSLHTSIWLNPPFCKGHSLSKWVRKSYEESLKGSTVCVLLAARTDTKFFKIIWDYAKYIVFFYGRLQYELDGKPMLDIKGRPIGATFPSALAVFTNKEWDLTKLELLGKIIKN